MAMMQVILRDDVPNLGQPGDVVRVRPGYARNFLLPRKLAVEANPKNLRAFEHEKRIGLVRRDAKRAESVKMKDRIERLTIEIAARAGEAGKLFGSVTNIDIERALGAQGVSIDRRRILLAEPIKELGEFVVPVRIDAEVEASLKLKVAAE
ncbi:MAG TPA: 50S ribosomal protein L9 [Candidatus Binataceae bacterium]|jgi:large subunit ribosomal protein L9|nr:50S ribosomal protein L9 [Candidatus Binataceae bacterium]